MIKELRDIPFDDFIQAAHRMAKYGLLQCSSGNMSWRINDEFATVTASGCWLERLTKDDLVICRISDGEILHGGTPSVESRFHFGILRSRKDVNVALHFQSPYATAIACSGLCDYDFSVIAEIPFYIGSIGFVDYLMPGSEELATAVINAAKQHNMILLQNHGLVTVGKDFDDAIQKARFFELACQILLCGQDLVPIPSQGITALRKKAKGEKV
jgi:ribulose-5-phosphate 4-epimerase/fuculose-1-phosphate aldolase